MRDRPGSAWFVILPLLSGLLLTGCIKIDSTLDVASDGSGTWRLVYGIPLHMIRQMEMSRNVSLDLEKAARPQGGSLVDRAQDIPYLFDEDRIRQRFKALEVQGIELSKIQTRSSGGWRNVDLSIKFTRLETLLRQPFLDSLGVSLSGAGTSSCKLVISLPGMGKTEMLPDPEDTAVSQKVSPFLNGLRVVSRIGFPGDIRNSTSFASDGRRATWEWDYDKDARALLRLSRDKMIVIFDSSGTSLRDFSKPALQE